MVRQVVTDPGIVGAEVFADSQHAGAHCRTGQHPYHADVVVADVGALVRGHARWHPPQPAQAHHVVDAQRPGAAHRRRDQVGERLETPLRQPLRMPRLRSPVLAALIEFIGRCAGGDAGDEQILVGPGVRAAGVRADGQVLDHSDVHACGPGRVLRRGELAAGEPLQPGVETRLPGQPPAFHGHRVRVRPRQPRRPRPPVGAVDLGEHAPRGPVGQGPALTVTVRVVLRGTLRAHRDLMQDLQRGPLRGPDGVAVHQCARLAGGLQRLGQGCEMAALTVVECGKLRDVLDPQIQRTDEPPAHRQVRRGAHRRHGLGGVQRVDEHESGAQVAGTPGSQVGQVVEVAVPP